MANRLLSKEEIRQRLAELAKAAGIETITTEVGDTGINLNGVKVSYRTEDLLLGVVGFSERVLEPLVTIVARDAKQRAPRPEAVRGSTHGDYTDMAMTAQNIKRILHATPNWEKMPAYMRESLELDATKVARIVHGDFMCYDHWDDRRGYSQLVLDRIPRPKA